MFAFVPDAFSSPDEFFARSWYQFLNPSFASSPIIALITFIDVFLMVVPKTLLVRKMISGL